MVTNENETVSNPIRYAGYQYDKETKLYYLNARYYDPKLARFLTEDTYRGQANDPLSLNIYSYVSNNPIKYTDPTGHVQKGDEKYNSLVQAELIALTNAYYSAASPAERTAIAEQAKLIRKDADKAPNAVVVTPLNDEKSKMQSLITSATAGKSLSADQWSTELAKVNITTPVAPKINYDGRTGSTATTTVITIGRTNVEVATKNEVSTNKQTNEVTNNATSMIDFSYNVNKKEMKFLTYTADIFPSVEVAMVAIDMMEKGKGKVTEAQLKSIGMEVSGGGFFKISTVDWMKTTYHWSFDLGISASELNKMYQEQVNARMAEGFGLLVAGYVAGSLRIGSARGALATEVEVKAAEKGKVPKVQVITNGGEYLSRKALNQVTPGTRELSGQYIDDLGRVQPWKAYYDEYGRLIARTGYNAGNKAQGIPDTHYHTYQWGPGKTPYESGSHIEGEYKP
ncbi:RHS repeat-associated core domain-containing protein [Cohnella soli]|uniref:RHS repeat-associated core domain-containing protein n=1 Tax=Cohnella soli TaxID=425005 RepID=A0ABW0HVG7_9BACL